tara:strand:+ start:3686 stop:4141 length:456 start_codon:yes stop_codon:yes gene_type:complete
MDINKIFDLFGNEESNDNFPEPSGKEVKDILGYEEFKITPTYQIKMFQKIILNHFNFQKKLVNLFKNSDPELGDFGDLEEAGEHMAYYRGWDYISKVQLEDENWEDCLKIQEPEMLLSALNMSIKFFESLEEYEKCSFLKKIINFLENNLD